MTYDPTRNAYPVDPDESSWHVDPYDEASFDDSAAIDDDSLYYSYLYSDQDPVLVVPDAAWDPLHPDGHGPYVPLSHEEDDEHEPVWTKQRVVYLIIALLIIAAMLLYLVLPLVEMALRPGSPVPLPPPDLL